MLFTNVRQSCGDCSAGFGLYIAASVQREPQGAVGPIKANISTSACVNQSQAQISGCSHHLSGEKYLSGFEVCTCFECHVYGKFQATRILHGQFPQVRIAWCGPPPLRLLVCAKRLLPLRSSFQLLTCVIQSPHAMYYFLSHK